MEVQINSIAQADNEALATLIRAVFDEFNAPRIGTVYTDPTTDDLFSLFEKERSVLYVARVNGEIAGSCGIYPTEGLPLGYAELVKFYILRAYRGKGVGKVLMERCEAEALALGYTHLYLESLDKFSAAVDIYQRIGFRFIDHRLGHSGHSGCGIWMVKEL
ncbi:MAG: GNAT family N-acetyltransferase [Flavobacteriales bacterium]